MPPVAVPESARPGLGSRLARMNTPGQVVASLAAVFAAYWLYALLVVPLIEPGVEQEAIAHASEQQIQKARQATSVTQHTLARFFPPGSWELDNPAVWESDQAMFVFKPPKRLPDGRLELRWCTLLVFPKNAGERTTTEVQPMVIRAADGAVLQFDQPVAPQNLDFSQRKLIAGQLKGEITIRRAPSKPGADDALTVLTRDMELVQDRAWTDQPVTFQMGRSHGSGRELIVNLVKEPPGKGPRGGAGSLRTLELVKDVVMNLDLGQAVAPSNPTAAPKSNAADSMVKITCQGPFQYDFARYAASFRDSVDVVRQATGPSDVVNCELLTAYFAHDEPTPSATPQAGSPAPSSDAQPSGLKVRVIEARGDPVTLRSPSRKIDIHCRGFNFFPGPPGTTGRIVAMGPGWLQGDMPKDTSGKYLVEWTREFRYEPQGRHEVASLHGGASVRFGPMGIITAKNRFDSMGKMVEEGQVFAWMTVTKPAPMPANTPAAPPGMAEQKWDVDRVTAQGDVTVDAPQLAGSMGKLEADIDRPPPLAPGPAEAPANGPPKTAAAQKPNATERISLEAASVLIKLVPQGQQFALADATLEGQAHLRQLSQPRPGEKPLVVVGDRLHVAGANMPQTTVSVAGRPGYLEAGGMVLRGDTINMEKQANRLWIPGPGRMTMPMEQDFNGKPLPRAQMVDIDWRGGMNFQTQTVSFERAVQVKSQWQVLATEKLVATLTRPVDFSTSAAAPRGKPGDRPQLAAVRTIGPAFLQSRQFDDVGKQTSFDQLEAFDLGIDQVSGAMDARGPGTLIHVGYGSQTTGAVPLVQAAAQRPAAPRTSGGELSYLNVQFERALTGNIKKRQVTFSEPTKTVYGPVSSWDDKLSPEDPQRLPPNSMVLDARTLTVREMPMVNRTGGGYELLAEGNVMGEGPQFFARGQKATFSQEKDHLVLEGDSRSPAELSYDDPNGGRRNARANMITYSIKLQHVRLSGAQSVGVDVLQNNPPKKQKK